MDAKETLQLLSSHPIINSIMELDFNRSYFKINNFSLMQSLNISSLTDDRLHALANEIPEISLCPFSV